MFVRMPCVCADIDVLIATCVPVCAGSERFGLHDGVILQVR